MRLNKEKTREYNRKWYASKSLKWKHKRISKQNLRIKTLRQYAYDVKAFIGCKCGEKDPVCLDFHHKTSNKTCTIARAILNGWCLEKLKAEIKKCIVLCANCHRRQHSLKWKL